MMATDDTANPGVTGPGSPGWTPRWPPAPGEPSDPGTEAEAIAYDALCTCDDTYGDNPWCPVCTYEEQWP